MKYNNQSVVLELATHLLNQAEKITFVSSLKIFPNYLYKQEMSPNTILSYENDMKVFHQFLKEHLNNKIRYVNDFTPVEKRQYKDYLLQLVQKEAITLKTAYRRYNTLKTFFRFVSEEFSLPNVMKNDKWGNSKKKTKSDFYEILEQEHINHLLNTIASSNDKNKYRDLVVFTLLISTGCRREDVLKLEFGDVSYARDELLLFHNKTSTGATVQLPPLLKKTLLVYEEVHSCTNPSSYVVRSRQANSLSDSAYTVIINKWVEESGIQKFYRKKITGHTFRHYFVTTCIRNNVPEQKIMEYTGHLDNRTLDDYKHLVAKDHSEIANMSNIFDIAI